MPHRHIIQTTSHPGEKYQACDGMMQTVRRRHYSWKQNFSRQTIVLALCSTPMVSVTYCTRMISLILGTFLGEIQINSSAQEIVKTLPYRTTVIKLLHETAAEALNLARMHSSGVKHTLYL